MNAQDLKNSILQLAIQGKLVEQREEEGTAKELFDKIQAEKNKLIEEGKIKKQKTLSEIKEDEIQFDIPESWEWVRFGEMVNFNIGKTPPRSEPKYWNDNYSWVSIADMRSGGYIIETKERISEIALDEKFKMSLVPKGTLLMSFKLTVGKVSILDIDAVHNEAIISIYPYANLENSIRDYLFTMLPLLSTYGETKDAIKGKTLNSTSLNNLLIPLPPLEEQKRIVAKIEELMPYVDKYDVAYSAVEELDRKFLKDMQNSILQYAIQGKLVEQREEEGTARELIKKIKNEKKQLIKEGKIRKEKPFGKIEEDEKPFDVPDNWEWIRFGDLGSYRKGPFGSALTKAIFVPKSENAVKVYEQKNAIQKDVNLGEYYITRDYFKSKMRGFELSPGDIIVSCAGTIGETYVMPDEFEQGIINQALMRMKLMPSVYIEYFLMYFDFILKKTARKSSKGSAIKNIPPFAELKNYVVPIPPIEEQKRIVAKIEELLPTMKKLY